jgi:hypothetical protein
MIVNVKMFNWKRESIVEGIGAGAGPSFAGRIFVDRGALHHPGSAKPPGLKRTRTREMPYLVRRYADQFGGFSWRHPGLKVKLIRLIRRRLRHTVSPAISPLDVTP